MTPCAMASIAIDKERILTAMDAIVRQTMNMDMMWGWPWTSWLPCWNPPGKNRETPVKLARKYCKKTCHGYTIGMEESVTLRRCMAEKGFHKPPREADVTMKRILLVVLALCCLAFPALAENLCKFDRTVTTLFEGETLQTALLLEGDPAAGEVTYSSGSEKTALVDQNGLVTGVNKGNVTITAQVKTEKRTFKATIALKVLRKVTTIEVSEDKLNLLSSDNELIAPLLNADAPQPGAEGQPQAPEQVLVLRLGTNQSIQATCAPKDASDRKYTLASSDESIVRVSGTKLQPKAVGECTITVSSVQNPEVAVTYRTLVVQPVTRLQLTGEKSTYVGSTLALTPVYSPENASIQAVTWSSANEKVATVDENGVVTGIAKGSATIKATAADGSGKAASFKVTVMQQPQAIELNETSVTINVGASKTLKATVSPSNTNNKKVTWSSSDESVATVNKSGRITPVSAGSCTITCQSEDFPGVSASATVQVNQLATRVAFAEKNVSLNVNTSLQVFWEVQPQTVSNPSVTFSSNKESIATVDANGLITGHKRGECYITVKTDDGSKKTDRIKVSVLQPVEGVHMRNDTLNVGVDESIRATAVLEPEDASNTGMSWFSADPTIATIRGQNNRPSITGRRWGTTTITGTTEDGGYTATATVNVGNYDKALKITDLYLNDNQIKMVVNNESNMTIARFYFLIRCYDAQDNPIVCHENGGNSFEGSYRYTLYEGDNTTHGRFYFGDFLQPETPIARVTMQIVSYSTDDGFYRDIQEEDQTVVEYKTVDFVGKPAEPTQEPAPEIGDGATV